MKKLLITSGIFLILVVAFYFLSCSDSTGPEPIDVDLDTKIGQMLLIGFRGLNVDENSQVVKDIKSGRIGGVALYDRDVALNSNVRNIESPSQVKNLVSELQGHAEIPLLVGIDQEGGRVARLKEKYGFPYNVSQQYLGELNNPDSTYFYGAITASTLSELGINLNFAPVIDLNLNPESPAIGKIERSFSADTDTVVSNALQVIKAHHDNGIYTTLKHFPGHGSAESDSHLGFTDVTDTWKEIELEPYKKIITAGKADVVMTAHIFNANLDPVYPATLSKKIITGILRDQLGFNGVIISDDMNMGAIADNYGLETAIELSINAGVDILIFANNLSYDEMIAEKAISIIKKLINEGKISAGRIDESYKRIKELKKIL